MSRAQIATITTTKKEASLLSSRDLFTENTKLNIIRIGVRMCVWVNYER